MTDVLKIPEAAKALGCTEACARAMAASRRIPAQKVGREWRFSFAAIMEWLSQPYSPKCQPSTAKKVRPTGTLATPIKTAKELDLLLAPQTKSKRKSTRTRSQQDHGWQATTRP